MRTYTVEEIQDELADLDKKLADYRNLLQRKSDLQALLTLTQRLRGTPQPQAAPRPVATVPTPNTSNGKHTHSDYLVAALRSGPKNINEVLTTARGAGWQGSGDDVVDKKRLYVALYREKDKFRLIDGQWHLTQDARASSA